jgi:hypothetical protein
MNPAPPVTRSFLMRVILWRIRGTLPGPGQVGD